jgi:hypothetical protein
MSKTKEASSPAEATQQMLVAANRQLVDTNKMLLAFMAALLLQKHNGSAVLNKNEVERNFYGYDVTWKPVIDGSEFFVLKAEPRSDVQ